MAQGVLKRDHVIDRRCRLPLNMVAEHAVWASMAASMNSCVHVTVDQEVSVKMLAEELKTLADATQIFLDRDLSCVGHRASHQPKVC